MKRPMIFLMLLALLLNGRAVSARGPTEERIGVLVTILPLAYFVENIGREKIDLSVMIPPGASPHTYEPTPSQLRKVSQAHIYVKVGSGVEFELAWMDKLISLNEDMLVCDASEGIGLMEMRGHHHHEEAERHHESGKDPHIWLSPINAILMALNIEEALSKVDPKKREFYARNTHQLILKLSRLNKGIKERLAGLKKGSFVVFHPAWGYFAADYDLKQIPIEIEGKEPTAKELIKLIREARKLKIKVLFASPQFSKKSAQVIAREIKGRVVFIDPLARDYIENLEQITDAFRENAK